MKICVFGLNHLGCTTAACLADKKEFVVTGLDFNKERVSNLNRGIAPIEELFLNKLISKNLGINLRFTTDIKSALKDAQIIWVTYDTPVDNNDVANTEYVKNQIISLYPYLTSNMTILISSQLPVGSTKELEEKYREQFKNDVNFAYSPENLRHGKAIEIFNNPVRIIVGSKDENNIPLKLLLRTICTNVIWMSVESAEMVKHSLNAFLAMEISFINEISLICEKTGANIKDVEIGLKSDSRVGEKAFLRAGEHYTGGTLGRDVEYLENISDDFFLNSKLIKSINKSNNDHKDRIERMRKY